MMNIPFMLYMMEQENIDMYTGDKLDASDLCYKVTKAIIEDELYPYHNHPYWQRMSEGDKRSFENAVIYCCKLPEDEITWNTVMRELSSCLEN